MATAFLSELDDLDTLDDLVIEDLATAFWMPPTDSFVCWVEAPHTPTVLAFPYAAPAGPLAA